MCQGRPEKSLRQKCKGRSPPESGLGLFPARLDVDGLAGHLLRLD
jgi:hypothetical protein